MAPKDEKVGPISAACLAVFQRVFHFCFPVTGDPLPGEEVRERPLVEDGKFRWSHPYSIAAVVVLGLFVGPIIVGVIGWMGWWSIPVGFGIWKFLGVPSHSFKCYECERENFRPPTFGECYYCGFVQLHPIARVVKATAVLLAVFQAVAGPVLLFGLILLLMAGIPIGGYLILRWLWLALSGG